MLAMEDMTVIFEEDGVTVRCLDLAGSQHWTLTRGPDASPDAIARARALIPPGLGLFDFPVTGEFTTAFYRSN